MAGKLRTLLSLILTICLTVVFCTTTAASTTTSASDFRLEVDSLNLQKGISSEITISLINAQGAKIVGIDDIENFDILSQSSSNSTSIVGNDATYQTDVYVTVMPKITGQFALKAYIDLDGNIYETNQLDVTVTEGSESQDNAKPDLFVETSVSHTEAYLGEKIIISYEVYSRENIEGMGFTDYLTIDGAVVHEQDSQITYETVYIDGVNYTKYVVKQLIIDPVNIGVCTIPSFSLQVNVLTRGGMGGFGGLLQSTTPKYLQTEEAEILIKQLPSAGKPSNFSGIVGELSMSGNYSRTELNYGDSLTLQVEVSGKGNLDGLKSIVGEVVTDFTVYENQKEANNWIENGEYHSKKMFEAILIPERNGAIDIPAISIPYFNPVTESYETAEIPAATISVLGEAPQHNTNNVGGGSGGISYETVMINQISYNSLLDDGYLRIGKDTLLVVIVVAALIVATAIIATLLLKSRRKQNTALQSMYKSLMKANDTNEIYSSFNAMIKHCFGFSLKANAKSSVINALPDSSLASQVTDIIDYVESPEAHTQNGAIALKKKIKDIYYARLRRL